MDDILHENSEGWLQLILYLWVIIEFKKSWNIAESQSFCFVDQTNHSSNMGTA